MYTWMARQPRLRRWTLLLLLPAAGSAYLASGFALGEWLLVVTGVAGLYAVERWERWQRQKKEGVHVDTRSTIN